MTQSRHILTPRRFWTGTELALLRELYPDVPAADVAALLGRPVGQIHGAAAHYGLSKSEAFKASDTSGRIQRGRSDPRMVATQFQPGIVPWNTGTHFVAGGRSAETRFKKGQHPLNTLPVGSHRLSKEGYLERKINNNPGNNSVRWWGVHRLVWIAAHGPVPPRHCIAFRPGTFSNRVDDITLDRLECISRGENAQRNHPRNKSPELARLVQLKGQITRQVNRITREAQGAAA